MNAENFVEIIETIKKSGQKIEFLSADFIRCAPTPNPKTGRSFVVCYSLEAGRWETFISFLGNEKPAEQ